MNKPESTHLTLREKSQGLTQEASHEASREASEDALQREPQRDSERDPEDDLLARAHKKSQDANNAPEKSSGHHYDELTRLGGREFLEQASNPEPQQQPAQRGSQQQGFPHQATVIAVAGTPAPAQDSDSNDQYADALRPGTILEDFRIDEVIGVGGFGIVYKALDLKLGRETAVKEYFPHSLARRTGGGRVRLKAEKHQRIFDAGMKSFINEAQILAKFDHPSLVKVYRFWEQNSTAYMAMPYYRGETLKFRLQNGDFDRSEESVRSLIVSLAQALQVMHASKCLHRDVSPDNVLILEETGQPVLLDFGAARKTINASSHAFTVILKSGYAPIEQYSEIPHLEQGPWTDVYALGALACYALTGQAPPPSVGRMVCDSAPRLAETLKGKGCNEDFLLAIDHCLAVLPDDRPQTMASLIRSITPLEGSRLDNFTQHFTSRSLTKALGHPKAKRPLPDQNRLLKIWMGVLAVLFLVSLGAGTWMIREAVNHNQSAEAARNVSPAESAARKFEDTQPQARLLTLSTPKKTLIINKDYLEFDLSSSHAGYLWIFLHGTDGRLMQIFPNDHSPDNWFEAGQIFHFPQSQQALMAAGPAGENHFLVIHTGNPLHNWTFPHSMDHGYKVISWNTGKPLVKLEQSLYRELGCQPNKTGMDKAQELDQTASGSLGNNSPRLGRMNNGSLNDPPSTKGCDPDLAAVLEFSIVEVNAR